MGHESLCADPISCYNVKRCAIYRTAILQLLSVTCHYEITMLFTTQHRWTCPVLASARQARFTYSAWTEGWVYFSGGLHAKMVYLSIVTRPRRPTNRQEFCYRRATRVEQPPSPSTLRDEDTVYRTFRRGFKTHLF